MTTLTRLEMRAFRRGLNREQRVVLAVMIAASVLGLCLVFRSPLGVPVAAVLWAFALLLPSSEKVLK